MTAKYRHDLPQGTSKHPFLTEAGMETTLLYDKNIALPHFAAIVLLETPEGTELLRECYLGYIKVAQANKLGIVLETRTWRGARPWAEKLGITTQHLIDLNRKAVSLVCDIRNTYETETTPIVISGTLGPLSDAYKASEDITREWAREQYHDQVKTLVDSGVDMISIMTMTNAVEFNAAIKLAQELGMPIVVSFNIEHDGMLLNHRSLEDTIKEVDAQTDSYVTYFGINCAHPIHLLSLLQTIPEDIRKRIGSIRANASAKTHEELDNSTVLDRGDIDVYTNNFHAVSQLLPELKVVGGCCGTDREHLRAIATKVINE